MNSLEYGQGGFGGVAVGLKRLAEFEVCASVTVAKERARRMAAKNRFICYSIKKRTKASFPSSVRKLCVIPCREKIVRALLLVSLLPALSERDI